jgi:hypothetical protein
VTENRRLGWIHGGPAWYTKVWRAISAKKSSTSSVNAEVAVFQQQASSSFMVDNSDAFRFGTFLGFASESFPCSSTIQHFWFTGLQTPYHEPASEQILLMQELLIRRRQVLLFWRSIATTLF